MSAAMRGILDRLSWTGNTEALLSLFNGDIWMAVCTHNSYLLNGWLLITRRKMISEALCKSHREIAKAGRTYCRHNTYVHKVAPARPLICLHGEKNSSHPKSNMCREPASKQTAVKRHGLCRWVTGSPQCRLTHTSQRRLKCFDHIKP